MISSVHFILGMAEGISPISYLIMASLYMAYTVSKSSRSLASGPHMLATSADLYSSVNRPSMCTILRLCKRRSGSSSRRNQWSVIVWLFWMLLLRTIPPIAALSSNCTPLSVYASPITLFWSPYVLLHEKCSRSDFVESQL